MTFSAPYPLLNLETLSEGLDYLSALDSDLARLYNTLGAPPLWSRDPGFPTLVHIILEQQVSLASARSAFLKLKDASGVISPETFLQFEAEELKTIGFSRQKALYCRELALAIVKNNLHLDDLSGMDDGTARSTLVKLKGIGQWTADIYLLMVLLRPDSWPSGDLALAVAVQEIKALPLRPNPEQLERIARPWQPWRAVAARLLWLFYLRKRNLA